MGNVRDDRKFVLYKRPPLFLFCGVLILVAYISSYVFELEPQAFIPMRNTIQYNWQKEES